VEITSKNVLTRYRFGGCEDGGPEPQILCVDGT
jgi:hypothetical protein